MKKHTPALLSVICTVLGLLCLFSRQWFLTCAVDQKGLLLPHAGNAVSWILTAAAIAVCLLLVLTKKPSISFENSPLNHGSTLVYALALGAVSGQLYTQHSTLDLLAGVLAMITALCAVLQMVCRLAQKPIPVFSRFPLILFYLFYLLSAYQHWSTQPQTLLYVFPLLALVCLTISAYHRAALELHMGNQSIYLISTNLAVFFCLAAVPGNSSWIFYLPMAPAVLLDTVSARQEV